MTDQELLDLYSDYLLSSFGAVTGTGLSVLLDGAVSHDQVQRFLGKAKRTSADLWQLVKPKVRQVQEPSGVIIIDDTIAEKPYTDENEIVCWHYDPSCGRVIKGINLLSMLYHVGDLSLPIGFAIITKTQVYVDPKDGKTKRRADVTKNELYRGLVKQAVQNQVPFKYVLNDVWFASAENMKWVKSELQHDFIMPLKTNRKVALTPDDQHQDRYQRVDSLVLEANTPLTIYLEDVPFPLVLVKQIFTNEDGSTAIGYLVTSDLTLTSDQITSLYHKRWQVERYHQSLKQNASLEKSPTRTPITQTNHIFAALCAYLKLEWLTIPLHSNHFAFKAKLYIHALHSAFDLLRRDYAISLAA
jgi:DDE superfamily endonuclease